MNRDNYKLNYEIEKFIDQWDGTITGQEVKNMYENGTSYEAICDKIGLVYEDFE
jgi:hypothetical protein